MPGPICGNHVVRTFCGSTGNKPFCSTITRSALSGNTSVACDQVHPASLGMLSATGLGQFCTGS